MELSAPPALPGPATAPQSDAAALSSDFETFLRLLTTQMQNQDPLEPMKAEDFAVQLATFSGVEQQVKTNDLLEALSARMGLAGLAETAGWVGMQARSTAPVAFDGAAPVALALPMPQGDRNELVVRDGAGNVVQRRVLSATATELSWDGTGASGAPVPPGTYGFTVESFRDGEYVTTSPVEAYDQVVEVRLGADGPVAVLRGGSEVASSQVTALRRP